MAQNKFFAISDSTIEQICPLWGVVGEEDLWCLEAEWVEEVPATRVDPAEEYLHPSIKPDDELQVEVKQELDCFQDFLEEEKIR